METTTTQDGATTEGEHTTENASGTVGTHSSTGVPEEHGEAFPPFDPSTFGTQLVWLAITFAALYVVISRMALPRIGAILDDRKARIDGDLNAADASRQKTDAAIAAYEAELANARAKSHALAEETRQGIKADIDTKRQAVEADLSKKVTEAETRIQATKTEALGHVGEIAADTVEALVQQLTGAGSAQEARDAVAQVSKE
ncbi:ATP F0F1 synthase subunit B [Devosia rhodophyticola]|uniref:ATP synthase subunit b n=1 Tax=Devosia rhodophyticola TaxID=3026423 RepID=A0ABY7YZ64_9HYPH|nr:ATP F0F1 synthase subunit B [Devosia rhodophyticola]WDR06541.1 ATP F0F1 synthase subunit B [Devosia rhodophyticola]